MNIGFVGVGRMGANMARRLKDRGFHVTAVYDENRAAATSLAAELGCPASQDLSEVTAESDVIFTVVTDDGAMREILSFRGSPEVRKCGLHIPRFRFLSDNQTEQT